MLYGGQCLGKVISEDLKSYNTFHSYNFNTHCNPICCPNEDLIPARSVQFRTYTHYFLPISMQRRMTLTTQLGRKYAIATYITYCYMLNYSSYGKNLLYDIET